MSYPIGATQHAKNNCPKWKKVITLTSSALHGASRALCGLSSSASIILHNSTQLFIILSFRNAFIVLFMQTVTSVNLLIYNTIFKHQTSLFVVVILDFCIHRILSLNFQRADESIQDITLKNINIMASYMHHCSFLKQKMGFQTSEQRFR